MVDNKKVNKIKFIIFLSIIILGIVILFKNWHILREFDKEKIIKIIATKGAMASIIYIGIYFIKPFFVVVPTNVLAIISGTLFGPVKGFIYTMLGFFISGTVAFYLARFLGKDFVEGIIGQKLMKLDDNMEKKGFEILFMLRLPPILPYDPLSYACGFTKIHYGAFIAASVLGVIPETLCYSILGENFNNLFSIKCIIPITILIIGVVFSKNIMNLGKKNKSV